MNWGIKMTDKTRDLDNVDLDALFADVRSRDHAPDTALMARIMADAVVAVPPPLPLAYPVESRGWFAGLWEGLGGWVGTGGLVAAAATGLWLGFAPPDTLSGINALIWGESQSISLFAADDVLGTEG